MGDNSHLISSLGGDIGGAEGARAPSLFTLAPSEYIFSPYKCVLKIF